MSTFRRVDRPRQPGAIANALTFGWRAVLKFKHVPEQLFDLVMTPVGTVRQTRLEPGRGLA